MYKFSRPQHSLNSYIILRVNQTSSVDVSYSFEFELLTTFRHVARLSYESLQFSVQAIIDLGMSDSSTLQRFPHLIDVIFRLARHHDNGSGSFESRQRQTQTMMFYMTERCHRPFLIASGVMAWVHSWKWIFEKLENVYGKCMENLHTDCSLYKVS